jgi:hypothetical protein
MIIGSKRRDKHLMNRNSIFFKLQSDLHAWLMYFLVNKVKSQFLMRLMISSLISIFRKIRIKARVKILWLEVRIWIKSNIKDRLRKPLTNDNIFIGLRLFYIKIKSAFMEDLFCLKKMLKK